jgi:hypothetical protein
MGVRRLAAAVSAGLLLPALAALPAHAQQQLDVTLSPSAGPVGTTVTASGSNCADSNFWPGGRDGALAFYNNVEGNFSGAFQVPFDVDADTTFSFTFDVPSSGTTRDGQVLDPLPPGDYQVDISCSNDLATTTFTITEDGAPTPADEVDLDIVHAIPDVDVDVYVGGELALAGFTYGEVVNDDDLGGLAVGDTIDVEVRAAGEDTVLIEETSITVPDVLAGSLVAHYDADSAPTLGFFEDLLDPLCTGDAGLVVRHTAGAPEVDVALEDDVVGTLANGDELAAALPEGTYEASGLLAGTDTVVLGPAELEMVAGVVTVVYATGSVENENLDLLVLDYEVGTEDCDETPKPEPTAPVSTAKPPTAVPAGQGPGGPGSSVAVAAFGLFLLAGVGATAAAARARRQDT